MVFSPEHRQIAVTTGHMPGDHEDFSTNMSQSFVSIIIKVEVKSRRRIYPLCDCAALRRFKSSLLSFFKSFGR
jgi:hypothetical protein